MSAIQSVREYLNIVCVGRETQVEAMLAAILTRNHIFFYGPPGTGKSMLANEFAKCVNTETFRILFGKTTGVEDVFGPLKISQLKHDKREYATDGYLADASIAFLDEAFKANNVVLNAMLGVLNERTFKNGANVVHAPLNTAILASNEVPEDAELLALYDRCLFRVVVDYVETNDLFSQIVFGTNAEKPSAPQVTLEELHNEYAISAASFDSSFIHKTFFNFIQDVRKIVPVSDRRAQQVVAGAQALAILNGKRSFDAGVWETMIDMLWHSPESRAELTDHLIACGWIKAIKVAIETHTKAIDKIIYSNVRYADDVSREAARVVHNDLVNAKKLLTNEPDEVITLYNDAINLWLKKSIGRA